MASARGLVIIMQMVSVIGSTTSPLLVLHR